MEKGSICGTWSQIVADSWASVDSSAVSDASSVVVVGSDAPSVPCSPRRRSTCSFSHFIS
eukprot:7383679-Prymnesium_polylepis.3